MNSSDTVNIQEEFQKDFEIDKPYPPCIKCDKYKTCDEECRAFKYFVLFNKYKDEDIGVEPWDQGENK